MSKIVAFCGSKGSGKSTSATIFKESVASDVEEIAIAGTLKRVCAEVFGLDINLFLDPALKEVELDHLIVLDKTNVRDVLDGFLIQDYKFDLHVRPHMGKIARTPRALLQYIGTEVLHPIDPLIHIKVAMATRDKSKTTLITDLRFVAEFNYLKEHHDAEFFPVYVKNASAEVKASVDSHASERQYVEFVARCRVLNNEGSLEALKSGIIELSKEL